MKKCEAREHAPNVCVMPPVLLFCAGNPYADNTQVSHTTRYAAHNYTQGQLSLADAITYEYSRYV